jgi:hypothetical protein
MEAFVTISSLPVNNKPTSTRNLIYWIHVRKPIRVFPEESEIAKQKPEVWSIPGEMAQQRRNEDHERTTNILFPVKLRKNQTTTHSMKGKVDENVSGRTRAKNFTRNEAFDSWRRLAGNAPNSVV